MTLHQKVSYKYLNLPVSFYLLLKACPIQQSFPPYSTEVQVTDYCVLARLLSALQEVQFRNTWLKSTHNIPIETVPNLAREKLLPKKLEEKKIEIYLSKPSKMELVFLLPC